MVASAQGVDVSRFQAPLDTTILRGLSFAFTKASEGLWSTDGEFARNWAAIRATGIFRGAYHELTTDDPVAQAAHFAGTVAAAGLHDGDMLAVVASDYSPTGEQVRVALDHVRAAVGPHHPVLLYSDLSRLSSLAGCTGYPLWIAHPGGVPASVAPWRSWTFWQWEFGGGADGGDRDAFDGDQAALDAWIASYSGAPTPVPPPQPQPQPATWEAIVATVPVIAKGSQGQAVKNWQGLLNARGHAIGIDGNFGPQTEMATVEAQKALGIAADGVCGPVTWKAALA